MTTAPRNLADLIIRTIKRALDPFHARVTTVERGLAVMAPTFERLASLEARVAMVAPVVDALVDVRERVAALEARPPVPGPPGQDGADGLGFGDLVADYDGERTVTLKAVRDERVHVVGVLVLPIPITKDGPWKPGTAYVRGDLVNWGDGLWHCRNATAAAQPGTDPGAAHWRLIIKSLRKR